jgi:AGZA family xanthine/uracil permease-like MFS transporter
MFKLAQHSTSPFVEVSAGLTTFFSMIYVLAANPAILSGAGLPPEAVFTATALGVIAATLVMALVANLPFAVAPGMGLNAFFVVVVVQMGYSWQQALTAVLISGAIFVILSVTPVRDKVLREVPQSLQHAVCAGIGLMISYVGLLNSGVINLERGPGLGDLSACAPLLAVIGLLVTAFLLAMGSRFAILFGIIITTVIGVPLGVTEASSLSQGFVSLPASSSSIFFKFDFSVLSSADFWGVVVTLLLMEIVDGLAGFLGLFGVMGADGDRYRPKMGRAFVADSFGVVIGSFLGLSPNTTYAESGAGVAAGGRTGLTATVVAAGFFLALFISPLFMIVPFSAVAPALVVVGVLMLQSVAKLDFKKVDEAFPAFVTIIVIAATWRISDGLALGWLSFILMKVVSGKRKELTTTVWVVGAVFFWKMFHSLIGL